MCCGAGHGSGLQLSNIDRLVFTISLYGLAPKVLGRSLFSNKRL